MGSQSEHSAPPQPDPARRGLMAIVGLLFLALIVGAVFVAKSFVTAPPKAMAGNTTRNGATAIEAGLEAAAAYQREKRFPEAVAILSKLAEQSPTDRAVRIAYAQGLIGQERFPEAYKQYEAAIALSGRSPARPPATDPSNSTASSAAPTGQARDPLLAQLHFEAGTCANTAGLTDRAEEHYWMAQVLDPAEARYPLFLAMMQLKKGGEQSDAAAGASLLRAVKVNPELAEGWGTMSELELRRNQLGLAAQHIEKARTLQPEVSRWRIVQARILNRQGEPEKAAAILQALPTSDRMNKGVLELQSESYGLLSKPYEAATMYERAEQLAPADADLAYQAALWFKRAGDMPKARENAQKASMLGHEGAKELMGTLGAK